jgi:MFS transporter, PPP family, 3-phenylpropionic acid transporter
MYLAPAFITLFFVYGAITPFLPILIRDLGYNVTAVGILLAISEGAGIIGPFMFVRQADRHGKYKACIALTYFLTAASAIPLAIFISPVASAAFIALLAIGYRSAMPLTDAIITIKLGETGNYGKARVFGSISFACIVLFFQFVPVMQPNTAMNIARWISMTSLLAIIVTVFLPLGYSGQKSQSENSTERSNGKSIWTPFFVIGLISIAFNRLAMTPVYSFLSLYLVEYMRWDAVGLMWALATIAEMPFLYLSNRIIRRFGAMPVLAFSSGMVGLRLALYAIFPFKAGIIIAQLLHSCCFGLFHPAAVAFISDSVPPKQRSLGMTLYVSAGTGLPNFIGNFIGGFIVDHAGYRALFGCFTIFAILSIVTYMFYYFYNTKTIKGVS